MGNKGTKHKNKSQDDNDGQTVSNKNTDVGELELWYRHQEEEELDSIPPEAQNQMKLFKSKAELLDKVKGLHITHICIKYGSAMPSLDLISDIAPQLEQLRIEGLTEPGYMQGLNSLKELRKLTFHDNNLSTGLPEVVSQLESLEELYIESSELAGNLQCLSKMVKLKKLSLSNNNFSGGLPEVISTMTSLDELYLNFCQLTDLPRSMSSLTKLKTLSLSYNTFDGGELSDVVGKLIKLQVLDLEGCELRKLPNSIGTLPWLKKLNLDNSKLSDGLPETVLKLKTLEELSLDNCELTTLPKSLASLEQLKKLSLSENKLTNLDVIGSLTSLEKLNLNSCDISSLPESLESLKQLKKVSLKSNHFSEGLPDFVKHWSSLEKLALEGCRLRELPDSISNLSKLQTLDLGHNLFKDVPSAVYELSDLENLLMNDNPKLERVETAITSLSKLKKLDLTDSESLQFPPYSVCQQGLSAVLKYFNDRAKAKGIKLTDVSVAVVGNAFSGKTSLVKSLKAGKRSLTLRDTSHPLDETTKVFKVEDLQLRNANVKFIDYGGHEVYHLAYQLVLKERCLPLIVVNMRQFTELSEQSDPEEATRKVCFDWISLLYSACPRLDPPILILTHKDKLSPSEFQHRKKELLAMAMKIKDDLLKEDQNCNSAGAGSMSQVGYFSDQEKPVFHPDDIFEFGNDLDETQNIEKLKKHLDDRCKKFITEIPLLWEKVGNFIEQHNDGPYISLATVKSEFENGDPITILRYMHNTGKILWFEKKDILRECIFHQIPKVTDLIALLFHHSFEDEWRKRLDSFIPFKHRGKTIGKHEHKSFVERFTNAGILDSALLDSLIKPPSDFSKCAEVAIDLLKCFNIIHGPIERQDGSAYYIVPYFGKGLVKSDREAEDELKLELVIELGGLSLRKYAYHLVTVSLLHTYSHLYSDSHSRVEVKENGVKVRHGTGSIFLIHDFDDRKITLRILTVVEQLGESWQHFIEIARAVWEHLSKEWKACRKEALLYCAQCLFLRVTQPGYDLNPPQICSKEESRKKMGVKYSALECVECKGCSTSHRPDVPKALKYPCHQISKREVEQLSSYLKEKKAVIKDRQLPEDEDADGELHSGAEEEESDLSDIEQYINNTCDARMSLTCQKVTKKEIKRLYGNVEKVYQMSDGVRGRVLIIDNSTPSSEVDCHNIGKLFTDLNFVVANILKDLPTEDIRKEIRKETNREEHTKLGMFVLVLMSQSKEGKLLGVDSKPIDVVDLQDLLSARHFSAMKDKPKLMIVQAYSEDCPRYGGHSHLQIIDERNSSLRYPKGVPESTSSDDSSLQTVSQLEFPEDAVQASSDILAADSFSLETRSKHAEAVPCTVIPSGDDKDSPKPNNIKHNIEESSHHESINEGPNVIPGVKVEPDPNIPPPAGKESLKMNNIVQNMEMTSEQRTQNRNLGHEPGNMKPVQETEELAPRDDTVNDVEVEAINQKIDMKQETNFVDSTHKTKSAEGLESASPSAAGSDSLLLDNIPQNLEITDKEITQNLQVAVGYENGYVIPNDGKAVPSASSQEEDVRTLSPQDSPLLPGHLNADHLFTMFSSANKRSRSPSHGSMFISVLVATFYNHSNHRDIEELYKIILERMRKIIDTKKAAGAVEFQGENLPTRKFPNSRKLYLFPNHPPPL